MERSTEFLSNVDMIVKRLMRLHCGQQNRTIPTVAHSPNIYRALKR